MELYVRISDRWPSVEQIKRRVLLFHNVREIRTYINFLIDISDRVGLFEKKTFLFAIVETIKANRKILSDQYDLYISEFLRNIKKHEQFKEYAEDIKRTCLMSYRLETRNKLACWYFKHIDGLCPDIIEKIINLV